MKSDIDRQVARNLNLSYDTVSRVTAEFVDQIVSALADQIVVTIPGLGRFRPYERRVTHHLPKRLPGGGSLPVERQTQKCQVVGFTLSRQLKDKLKQAKEERNAKVRSR